MLERTREKIAFIMALTHKTTSILSIQPTRSVTFSSPGFVYSLQFFFSLFKIFAQVKSSHVKEFWLKYKNLYLSRGFFPSVLIRVAYSLHQSINTVCWIISLEIKIQILGRTPYPPSITIGLKKEKKVSLADFHLIWSHAFLLSMHLYLQRRPSFYLLTSKGEALQKRSNLSCSLSP